ncbi:germination protein YpeB [Paenibacillus thailandensis]|uniref:Germination protein YpeB n=1 Tax=Paenibacillus thailandensis TaxID=393250 RepID=A0ABW5R0Y6_9BACL
MYQRLSAVLFPVFAILFVGAAYWGYQEHQDKNSILIKAENQYQRAFHDLTYHVQQLHKQLGNTLAVNSTSQNFHRKGLVNVWRITSQAQNDVDQLPVTMIPIDKAEELLSKIANFSYKTAVRDLTKEPLTESEFKTLKTLYANSKEISKDLQDMQQQVLVHNLRWMDVEMAVASEKQTNKIVDGFRSVNKKVGYYPEIDWGPSVTSMYQKRSVNMLSGKQVSAGEIKAKAANFLGIDQSGIRVTENGKGTSYATFSVTAGGKGRTGSAIAMDYTQKGGQLVWFMNSRDVKGSKLSRQEAEKAAAAFLDKHGFKEMKPVAYNENDNIGTFTYVGMQDGVLVYPDKLNVKIALDNGDAVGLHANEYIYEHHKRTIPKPKLSKEEARKSVNPDMEVTRENMAVIKGEAGKEVLCYEYTGRINGGTYRIYINADNGTEEAIEEITAG